MELRGFTAFRDPASVDFADLDVFAVAGPTGSGKSSLLDAMTYALFGRVERVGDQMVDRPVLERARQILRLVEES